MRLLTMLLCCATLAAAPTPADEQKTVRALQSSVQAFYDWYAPRANHAGEGRPSDAVLTGKRFTLGSRLAAALKEDSAAQDQASEIVGLDFDPFLNTQEPCERYVVGGVHKVGSAYLVDVHGVCGKERSKKPDVVVEAKRDGSRWIFVNFRYPPDDDLLSILGLLKRDRKSGR
ncbi:MAG TPA: hypothetical protein VGR02_20995 [Thermoanaerobaculia bacterium]|jgi:hypothetical protein|nr:hypothetical protein [Thermoanaerobaculia bacterium]